MYSWTQRSGEVPWAAAEHSGRGTRPRVCARRCAHLSILEDHRHVCSSPPAFLSLVMLTALLMHNARARFTLRLATDSSRTGLDLLRTLALCCSQRRAILRRHGGERGRGGEGGHGRQQREGQGEGLVQVSDQSRQYPQGARQVAPRVSPPAGLRAQLHCRQSGCALYSTRTRTRIVALYAQWSSVVLWSVCTIACLPFARSNAEACEQREDRVPRHGPHEVEDEDGRSGRRHRSRAARGHPQAVRMLCFTLTLGSSPTISSSYSGALSPPTGTATATGRAF